MKAKKENKNLIQKINKNQKGQGLTEYIVIVALVFIGAIGVITIFGENLRDIVNTSAKALSGEVDAKRGIKGSKSTNDLKKNLDNFGQKNKGF